MIDDIPLDEIHENLAQLLEGYGGYRILRKLKPPTADPFAASDDDLRGVFVDTETTGLSPEHDEIIELAMVPFRFTREGRITTHEPHWEGMRQPSIPIPSEVTAINGTTEEMVAGRVIDPAAVAAFIAPMDLVIGHNAAFDRPFLERFCAAFAEKQFGCSMCQIDWRGEGHESTKLSALAADYGFYFDKHRALNDCQAGLELLSRPLLKSGAPALGKLLEQARQPTWRIWATGAAFESKEMLRGRGYKWHDGSEGPAKAWYADVVENDRDAELRFLSETIFRRPINLPQQRLTARDRFSVRAMPGRMPRVARPSPNAVSAATSGDTAH